MHGGCNNLVQNNILVNGEPRQLSLAAIFSDRTSTTLRDNAIRRNVVAYSNRSARLIWSRAGRWSPECLRECDRHEDSPAYAMGFQRIPVDKIGPEGYERFP
jgi:hypothetical protein